jgi:aminomethyltransferase
VNVSPLTALFPDHAPRREWRGWQVADHYGDPQEEAAAVRQAAGVVDRAWRAKVEVRGRDRVSFLQSILSNDLKPLQPGQGCVAAFLTPHGKVIAFMRVLVLPDCLYLELDDDIKARAFEALDKLLVSERVELSDATADWSILSVEGPRSPDALGALGLGPLPDHPSAHAESALTGLPLRVVRAGETGEVGFDLWVPTAGAPDLWRRLLEAGGPFGLRPVGLAALNALRVEAGVAWSGVDVTEETLLLEVPFEHAVSYTKGCYVGQEVVARVTYRGHVNRKLTGLIFPDAAVPAAGSKVTGDGKEIGVVTSPVYSPTLKRGIALAFLGREWLDPGKRVEVRTDAASLSADVTTLPFYRRD